MSKIRITHTGPESGDEADFGVQIADSLGNVWPALYSGQTLDLDLSGGAQFTAQIVPKPIEYKEAEAATPMDETERNEKELREADSATQQAARDVAHHEGVQAERTARQEAETKLRDADYADEEERPRYAEE